ncbi:ATP-binding cassette domain-containing protein [Cylindrospermopsis raciborskii CHAB3438]|jgi:ABC-2 type transport system ATP-binding protein|uniref:ABC transporter ATP-binding protein n=1 Tax=Cylindrospermopsis TaxID=77021 RepID=UPI00070B375E|nr:MULTISPECIES: ABC transporter ATP-binding protein [Cylindrospermopsis]MBU6344474.1 ABC transporter ATP-binding protein [Cyanobacteria bacterium REEB494]KRH95697.1 multidrug ABC transporter ATP-binding protein [Cylindrospermopsis sp. CR12]MCH4905037.1 ATP-binding cassette domain-containing protein [Cylindrospermopsis raciborskii CHAB3438]TPX27295.1 ABC transporter ATP-binding protein [Cylindrospermopsis raciborskii GIHE 2018]UJL33725.1 ABC transporter ATP-binding protein [Cylindrospermopsis 
MFNNSPAILTSQVSKVYRTGFWSHHKIISLHNCSLEVYPGETFGLLGPNGAGKTTLLKILLGISRPSSGKGFLLGKPLGDRSVKQFIGYLPENPYFYDYLTGYELLELTGEIFRISSRVQRQRIVHLLELVGLSQNQARKQRIGSYSKGMVQRIGLAQALINDPKVLFLDEPMSGLDPLAQNQMREIILSLKSAGKTIFFNSHMLGYVEQICDRIGILNQGEIICSGSLSELLGEEKGYYIRGKGGDKEILQKRLGEIQFEREAIWHGILKEDLYDFLASLRLMGGKVIKISLCRQSLEDFFIQQLSPLPTQSKL